MPLPNLRFQDIRSYEGSQNTGFEELCCQLAGLETGDGRVEFLRKGRGADAGVECFIKHADGSERGWQAKYVESWDASLEGQLNKSVRTALDKHPSLCAAPRRAIAAPEAAMTTQSMRPLASSCLRLGSSTVLVCILLADGS